MTQQFWDETFPDASENFSYQGFLEAAAKFPKFCNESNHNKYTPNQSCKVEISTIFAHIYQETKFIYTREIACDSDPPAYYCDSY